MLAHDSGLQFELPKDAQPLCVQLQHGEAQIWYLVDPRKPTELRRVLCVGTGEDFGHAAPYGLLALRGLYIGTIQERGVWHFFDWTGL